MTRKIGHNCKHFGCPTVVYDGLYCEQHQPPKQYKKRTQSTKLFDTARWKRARKHQLTIEPMCRRCKREWATEVDHIIPRFKGGEELAQDNLQSLCRTCHEKKSLEDIKG